MAFPYRTPTRHLGHNVAVGVHRDQRGSPARAVAAPPQARWIGVEHLSTTEHLDVARDAPHQAVAENQRQPPVQGEPTVVGVERSQPRGHGRGTDMHDQLRRDLGQRAAGGATHVERAGARPRVGGEQCVAAADGVARCRAG